MRQGDVLLGKFRIERVLGRGGMGLVVAARHVALDELFAMKLMHPEMLSNPEAIERFVREARASARLKGEHVARVHDVGRLENGAPYMLMEHLVGDDLSGLLDKRGALPVREAVHYVLQACDAIAEAHGQGIVHRDLKPANLFLTARANGSPCIKVLDFGISKKIDSDAKFAPTLTVTGAVLGSPAFMSPEQMLNGKTVDMRSDIWALGAILYELTTGALPFHGESMTELVARVMHEPPTPPSTLRPEISGAFDNVVLTCLQKRAARRYQSIEELMAALRPFAEEKAQPPKAIVSVSGLPRVDDGPDSARSTRIVNPRPVKALSNSPSLDADESVDSEGATRVMKPIGPSGGDRRLPSAIDTEFRTTSGHTVEMTTHVQQLNITPQTTSAAPIGARTGDASRLSRLSFLGVGILGGLTAIAVFIVIANTTKSSDTPVAPSASVISAGPEVTPKSAEVLPMTDTSSSSPISASNASVVASAKAPPKAGSTALEIARPGATSKQPTRTIKPTLY